MKSRAMAIGWIAVAAAISVAAAANDGALGKLLALAPARIWRGEVWRLATWCFAWDRPIEGILCAFSVYRFAPELIEKWGAVRFAATAMTVFVATGVATCVVALVVPTVWTHAHLGGYAVSWLVAILHARTFPTSAYYMQIARGAEFEAKYVVWIGIGVSLLGLVAFDFARYTPQVIAVALAAIAPIP